MVASAQLISLLLKDINNGMSLAAAMARHPDCFSQSMIYLVGIGEESHDLAGVLHQITGHMAKKEALARKVKKAIIYPASVLFVGIAVSWILLAYAVPEFEAIFRSANVPLPMFTRGTIAISRTLQEYWWLILLLLIFFLVTGFYTLSIINKNMAYAKRLYRLLLKLPIIGKILIKSFVISYSRSIAISLKAGISLSQSLSLPARDSSNPFFTAISKEVADKVTSGDSFKLAAKQTNIFPSHFIHMIGIGEASHSLDSILFTTADIFEKDIEYYIDTSISVLETMLTVFIGLMVGIFVISMYMPMFNVGQII